MERIRAAGVGVGGDGGAAGGFYVGRTGANRNTASRVRANRVAPAPHAALAGAARAARFALAPPPAKAGGRLGGGGHGSGRSRSTPPRPSPAFAGEGAKARGWSRSRDNQGNIAPVAQTETGAEAPVRPSPAWRQSVQCPSTLASGNTCA